MISNASATGRSFFRTCLRLITVQATRLIKTARVLGLLLSAGGLAGVAVNAQPADWKTVMPALGTGTLYDVTVDTSSRFWAVGDGGVIGVSDDGYRWRAIESGSDAILKRVYADEAGILIGGTGGLILSSVDGETVSVVRDAGEGNPTNCAGFATNGIETLAVFSDGTVYRSDDRQTWSGGVRLSSLTGLGISRVIYEGGRYVAIGVKGSQRAALFTSTDGVIWDERSVDDLWTASGSSVLGAVVYEEGRYLLASRRLGTATSVDGVEWLALNQPISSSEGSEFAMAAANGELFATYGLGRVSRDGSTWASWAEDDNAPDFELIGLAHNGRNLVVTGRDGRISTRGPAGDWTDVSWTSTAGSPTIVSGNGVFLSVNGDHEVAISHDGERWRTLTIPGHRMNWPSFAGGRFFLSSNAGPGVLWSEDAETWSVAHSDFRAWRIVYGGGKWFGTTSAMLHQSTDGLEWNGTSLPVTNGRYGIAWGAGRLVLAASSLWSTEDGASWVEVETPEGIDAELVAFGANRFVALSSNGLRGWHSLDGEHWTVIEWSPAAALLSSAYAFVDLHYAGGYFVAAAGPHIFYSADGLFWSEDFDALPASSRSGYHLAYEHGRWVAAGANHTILATPLAEEGPTLSRSEDMVVSVGTSGGARLAVEATGTDLTYQWYEGWTGETADPVEGADQATLDLGASAVGRRFWVRVSAGRRSVDSETFRVEPATVPSIAIDATRYESRSGDNLAITANVSGAPFPQLQWYRGEKGDTSDPIVGATGSSLVLLVEETYQDYWLRAENVAGVTESTAVRVVPWVPHVVWTGFRSVRALGSRFVALRDDSVFESSDGLQWTKRATIANETLYDVAQFGSEFMVVGRSGVYGSTDLRHWTAGTLPSTAAASFTGSRMAVGADRVFMARQRLFSSTDGAAWVEVDFPESVRINDVMYASGMLYAVGGEDLADDVGVGQLREAIFVSFDGVNWDRVSLSSRLPALPHGSASSIDRIAFVEGQFRATVNDSERLYSSPDGVVWTAQDVALGSRWNNIAGIDGTLVIGSEAGNIVSEDGETWVQVPGVPDATSTIRIGDTLVRYGAQGIFQSTDGVRWETVASNLSIGKVAHGGGRFVAIESRNDPGLLSSRDGLVWKRIGFKMRANSDLVYGGRFGTGDIDRKLKSDVDGGWTELFTVEHDAGGRTLGAADDQLILLPQGAEVSASASGSGVHVAVGQKLWRSSDLETWDVIKEMGFFNARVVFGDGLFIVSTVSENQENVYLTSSDGRNWTARKLPGSTNAASIVEGLAFVGGHFYMGLGDQAWVSDDGIDWSVIPGVTADQSLVAANGEVFSYNQYEPILRRAWDGLSPRILDASGDAYVPEGTTVTLAVRAAGEALSFQWFEGESGDVSLPLPATNSAQHTVVAGSQIERLWVRVTSGHESVDSATMRVMPSGRAPTILKPPAPFSMIPSLSTAGTLSVEAQGEGDLRYQWYQGNRGDLSRPVGMKNASQLWLNGSANGGRRYWVRVSNDYGATDSASVPVELWSTKSPLWSLQTDFSLEDAAFGNGRFVAVGRHGNNEGRVGWSTDGQVWTQGPTPERFHQIAFGDGRFVASTFNSANTFWTTTDGQSWSPASQPYAFPFVRDLFYLGELFVAVSADGSTLISEDGLTWVAGPKFDSETVSFVYGNSRYLAVEADGRLLRSDDFARWTLVPALDGQTYGGVAWLGDRFVALNAKGQSLVSNDGIAWRYQIARHDASSWLVNRGFPLRTLTSRIQSVVALDNYGSEDGLRWWRTPSGFSNYVAGNGTTIGLNGYNLAWAKTLEPDPANVALPQDIELNLPTQLLFGGAPIPLSATATSGDPVTYVVEEGPAQIVDHTLVLLGTGTVVIRATQAGDEHYAPASIRFQFESTSAPTIVEAPADQLAFVGAEVTFAVQASGGALGYQWQKDGEDIQGEIDAELTIAVTSAATAGTYRVVVRNAVGSTTSGGGMLTVWNWEAAHQTATDGFVPGASLTVNNTLNYSGPLGGLTWSVLIPRSISGERWMLTEMAGDFGDELHPSVSESGLLELSWSSMPASPVQFSYTLSVPENSASRAHLLTAMVTVMAAGSEYSALVNPEPLILTGLSSRHSADYDGDGQIALPELLRIIELYNTRFGTTRTGRYKVAAGTLDGFAADPEDATRDIVTEERHHTADFNQDGQISLPELLRVIELYNVREGTQRTGRYRSRSGTIDGFATGVGGA